MKKLGLAVLMGVLFGLLCVLPVAAGSVLPKVSSAIGNLTVKPGETTTFEIIVRNDYTTSVDVKTVANPGPIAVGVVSPESLTAIPAGGSAIVQIQIWADPSFAGTTGNPGSITFKYGTQESRSDFTINVLASSADSAPTPAPAQTPDVRMTAPGSYIAMEAGKASSVDVTLQNVSSHTASDVKIFPVANRDFRIEIEQMGSFNLSARAEKKFKINVVPDKNLAAGDYEVSFEYTYLNNVRVVTTGRGTIYVKIAQDAAVDIQVSMVDFAVSPATVVAGDSFTLSANVKNLSAVQVNGMRVNLTGLTADGISINNATTSQTIGAMAAKTTQAVSYTLTTSDTMRTGSYEVMLVLSYIDARGETVTVQYPFYVAVQAKGGSAGNDARAVLEITSITRPTNTFAVGQDIRILATVKNVGNQTAKGIKMTATPEAELLPQTANIQVVNALEPGQSQTIAFTFAATKAARSQNYNIGFAIDYETGAENGAATDSFMQYVGVRISNPEAEQEKEEDTGTRSIPKIIVSNYVVDPLIVMAGKEFDLDLTYMNTHATKGVYNIKVSAAVIGTSTEKGNVFTPVGSSNTFYIDAIAPKNETTQHLRMYTVPDAQPKNYILTVQFEYEDEEGNQLTATEEVGINVQQVANLEIGNVFMPMDAFMNESVYLSFTVQNRGAVLLRNLKIRVEGDNIEGSNSEIIFGNFQAGAYDYYDGNFFLTAEGPQEVRIVISYDNDMLEPVERVETYTVNVMPGYDWNGEMGWDDPNGWSEERPGMMPDDNQGILDAILGVVTNPWVWGSAIGVVVIAGGVIVWLVKRKQNKEMDLDEQS